MSDHTIGGKTVLIGGGAKNLGGLIARDLAEHGAKGVVVHYNSPATRAQAENTAAAVQAAGANAHLLQADLTSAVAVQQLFADATQALGGPIDIAVNTTGMVIKKPISEVTEEEFDRIFAINAKTAFFFIQQAGKHVSQGGKITTVVTSLLAAFTGLYSIYAGSKSPVEHFTRAASKEFGDRGISVTAIAPGPMETPFFYGQETAESASYNQNAADLFQVHQDRPDRPRRHRPGGAVPGQRRLVGDRTNHLRQRRLHDTISTRPTSLNGNGR